MSRTGWQLTALFVVAALLMAPESALACPVCFGDSDAPAAQGMNKAVFTLLAIIGAVQILFVALFASFWLRAKRIRERKAAMRLIHGGLS